MLPFFLYSTLLTWILPRLILISFSSEPRLIVNLTFVPSLPLTTLTTWSKGLPTTDLPLTFVTTSLGWRPAFSAGESFIGLVIIISLFFFCISAPIPTKSPDTSSLKLFVSDFVMYSEFFISWRSSLVKPLNLWLIPIVANTAIIVVMIITLNKIKINCHIFKCIFFLGDACLFSSDCPSWCSSEWLFIKSLPLITSCLLSFYIKTYLVCLYF